MKDSEARLLAQVESKFFEVRKLLGVESRARYESIEQVKGSLENDLPRLQELIQTEIEGRGKTDSSLFAAIDEEVKRCVDAIEKERAAREE